MDVVEIRKELHQIPELGGKEFKTKEYIIEKLKDYPCELFHIGKTSIVAYYNFNKKESICFRSDMDGLPIEENNDFSFKSKHIGRMHACGHDGHMAILIGLCEYISKIKDYPYNIICLFQSNEENGLGAKEIIESNILNKLHNKYIFGLHIWPNLEKGKIFSKNQELLAFSGEINIIIKGKSVHAADKNKGKDAIFIACKLLEEIYSFDKKIKEKHLIYFGRINGGTKRNIVADKVLLEGTIRALNENTYKQIKIFITDLVNSYNDYYKIMCSISVDLEIPCVYNDNDIFKKFDFLNYLSFQFLQAEDFGVYHYKYPSLLALLGSGKNKLLHSPDFDFDMDILEKGVKYFIQILDTLRKEIKNE